MGAFLATARMVTEYTIAALRLVKEIYMYMMKLIFYHCHDFWLRMRYPGYKFHSGPCTDNPFDALIWRKQILDRVVDALGDPNTRVIGVCGSSDASKATLLERVLRRVRRDNLFTVVLMVSVTKKPDIRKIQEEIAHVFGLKFQEKTALTKRASLLYDRIKEEQKILVILRDLFKGLDLAKVGIPFGADHTGCKILLTSSSEEVLSNQMQTQKNFIV